MPRQVLLPYVFGVLALCCLAPVFVVHAEEPAIPSPSPSPAAEAPLSADAQNAIRLLSANELYDRHMGFLQLEALREPAALPVIRPYLNDRNAEIRSYAVRALAAIAGVKAVPELLERLKTDKSPTVRIAVILGVETLPDPAVLPALIQRMRDRNPEVRMALLDAVSRFKDPRAREAILLRQHRERNRDVQRVLQDAVQRVQSSS